MFKFSLIRGPLGPSNSDGFGFTGTAVALFVFCFVNAVQDGLKRLTEGKQA